MLRAGAGTAAIAHCAEQSQDESLQENWWLGEYSLQHIGRQRLGAGTDRLPDRLQGRRPVDVGLVIRRRRGTGGRLGPGSKLEMLLETVENMKIDSFGGSHRALLYRAE